jgi:mono/diheme cytochrome c family protein
MLGFPKVLLVASMLAGFCPSEHGPSAGARAAERLFAQFVGEHCLDCHNATDKAAGLDLDQILGADVAQHAQAWEAVVRKLATRQMPPSGSSRPDEKRYEATLSWLTGELDAIASRQPNPGRTDAMRRLNRTEYRNAIRDLLGLEVDVNDLLPADESSHGFDNVTVTDLSPSLLNRYLSAAEKISRTAVGIAGRGPGGKTFRVRPDITQDHSHVDGLPLGTRGGTLVRYQFPQDGEYEVQVWLMRDRNDELEGLKGSHVMEVLLDREFKNSFTITRPPRGQSDREVDGNLKTRFPVSAGLHELGVTFVSQPFSLVETERQPLNVHYNFYRHPRLGPAVFQVAITGPFAATQQGDSPSRRRIFTCYPTEPNQEAGCAQEILKDLMRLAYRRPVHETDLAIPMKLFQDGRQAGGFELGIQRALAGILVSPHFLFRVERDPPNRSRNQAYRISDLELASRLSFFLWSSLPDSQLIDLAERGELSQPQVLEQEVRRMLQDARSESLVTNFADQWLYLRNLESVIPDGRIYPDFDHNLRDAFRRETEMLFESVLRDDLSVLALLDPGFTFLNERLAKHYGIRTIHGSHFRKVRLDKDAQRGGILRHGSILSVTSYATRTSPVIRGKWILENMLGAPPPPPPANVPALEEVSVSANLPVRERLAAHRANTACAVCHDLIDPVGFGLENFDAVGRWRELEVGQRVESVGSLPDGKPFEGVAGLEAALLSRPELFAQTLTEKLMVFAMGRGLEYYDAPAVRQIVGHAKPEDYRFSELILGIVRSVPFQMRSASAADRSPLE